MKRFLFLFILFTSATLFAKEPELNVYLPVKNLAEGETGKLHLVSYDQDVSILNKKIQGNGFELSLWRARTLITQNNRRAFVYIYQLIPSRPALNVSDVQNVNNSACVYADQAALDAAFATWLSEFGYSGGCDPQGGIVGTPTAPQICTGGTVNVTLNVTDLCENGQDTASFTITPEQPTCNASVINDEQCVGVPINLSVEGAGCGGPFTYEWSDPSSGSLDLTDPANPIFNGGDIGTHDFTVTVTDAKGCISTCNVTATVIECIVDCGTAFGVALDQGEVNDDISRCFRLDGFNRWGWTNYIAEFGNYTLSLYRGAGKCDLNKGTYVGRVDISYTQIGTSDEGEVNVTYTMAPGFGLEEAHLYIGCEKYPTKPNGAPTVAPGQYQFKESGLSFATTWDTDDADITATGGFYIIAHAVACGSDIPDGSFYSYFTNGTWKFYRRRGS